MSDTYRNAKDRWNAAHYTQVKVSIQPDIAAAFKAACQVSGQSMASILSDYMAEYAQTASRLKKPAPEPYATRKVRRQQLKKLVTQLEQIMEAEERYRDNIPENLQGSVRYEAAQESVEALQEALDLLEQVY